MLSDANSIKKYRFLKILVILGIFCALTVFYLGVSYNVPYTSDNASMLLEAKSIVDGDTFLKGWTLSTVSYYTTEMPFYIIGIWLFGFSEKVIYLVTAINYALLTLTIIYITSTWQPVLPGPRGFSLTASSSGSGSNRNDGVISIRTIAISLCLSLFIAALIPTWELHSPVHIVGFTYCLWSIFFLKKIDQPTHLVRLVGWGFLLLLAFFGDNFTIYAWGLPVIIILSVKAFTEKNKSNSIKYLVTIFLSILLSKGILYLISANGGLSIPGVVDEFKFVDYPMIGNNLYLFFIGLFDLFSVNFFGQPIFSINTILSSFHVLGLALFCFVVLWSVKHFRKLSTIQQILTVGIVLNLAEYLLGNVSINRATVRYLMPSLIYSILLMTSLIGEGTLLRYPSKYLLPVCILIGLSLIPALSFYEPELPVSNLSEFLISQHLQNGYGPYWVASITTVHSGGAVSIRPVICTGGKSMKPYDWLSEEDWYQQRSTFLVVDRSEKEKSYNITEKTAVSAFGTPRQIYRIDGYEILVWDKDISPKLALR